MMLVMMFTNVRMTCWPAGRGEFTCVGVDCSGTTAAAMRAGKPTVIIPFANDEFDNARRARTLGCSVTLHAAKLSASRLERALREASGSASIRTVSAALGTLLRQERGAATAADGIERTLGLHPKEGS
jgi:UDP:flavonoid glycosyltransferase YjiC (YdhE family)